MNTIYRYGALSALILAIASGCSDNDSPAPPGHAGAAGKAGGANNPAGAGGADVGGSPGAAGGAGEGAAEGGTGGALVSEGGAGGDLAGGDAGAGGAPPDPLAASTVLDVNDVKTNPAPYDWFDFKPNVKKLILAGSADTEHIAILWYTVTDGGVALHYHPKTESVYVIDGTQTDAKGVYTNGTVYFNPPGSGHQITDSSGFFLLAYAAPPDFANTDLIEAYSPVRIDATLPDLTSSYAFTEQAEGIKTYDVPLAETGGLSAELLETTSAAPFTYHGNYLLVLAGSCKIEGVTLGQGRLIVAKTVDPRNYGVSAPTDSTCRTLGISFD